MISVEDAQARVVEGLTPLGAEAVKLRDARGRVLADDLVARISHPPCDVSAMDGYAVRVEEFGALPVSLTVIGTSAAGAHFPGNLATGQAVRIFTGAPVPRGTSGIIIQENTRREGDNVVVLDGAPPVPGQHIRRSGLDFRQGEKLLNRGTRLNSRDIALAAAMNYAELSCTRLPRVAILANGDELVPPGATPSTDQSVSSSPFGLAADIADWGAHALDLGIARDDVDDIRNKALLARNCDVFVTMGGASVGDHDLVQKALSPALEVNFWKIAMRPGKPLIFGRFHEAWFLGLPGNPVSSFVCALLFLKPMIYRMLGAQDAPWKFVEARLLAALPANDSRQEYRRCLLHGCADGRHEASPLPIQDSSMLRALASADALIVRPPFDASRGPGESVSVLILPR